MNIIVLFSYTTTYMGKFDDIYIYPKINNDFFFHAKSTLNLLMTYLHRWKN